MKEANALFLFCEGSHDVGFCYLVFKYLFGLKTFKEKFSRYPAPLHKLLAQNLQKHTASDLSLDMAHKFFLPDRTLIDASEQQLVLLFNIGGKTQLKNPQEFLSDFLPLYVEKQTFAEDAESILADTHYLFLFDADYDPWEQIVSSCHDAMKQIDGKDFIEQDFDQNEATPCGATSENKAVYVLGDSADNTGTLENILLPIYRDGQQELIDKSRQFIDDAFTWNTEQDDGAKNIAVKARRTKAIITSAGQGKKPGRPMTAIIQDNILGAKQCFVDSVPVQLFADFIEDFAGIKKNHRTWASWRQW